MSERKRLAAILIRLAQLEAKDHPLSTKDATEQDRLTRERDDIYKYSVGGYWYRGREV